ncbi:MAG TPA: metallophosphoesterase family protein [Solirubrobacteraceae bacterium]|jgi:predicted phosphodiesterase
MHVAMVSDIHGNRHAFEAVLEAVDASDAEQIWCLGDLVGYCAEPDACVELAVERCEVVLSGNHDLAVTGALSLEEFSPGAAAAARWTRETIARRNLEALRPLLPQDLDHDVGLFHASPRDPIWEYVLSTLQAELCLDAQRHRICVVGHSHVALAFVRRGEGVAGTACPDRSAADLTEGSWIVNPGSVGQPRDGDPRAAWMLLDLERWTASWRRVPYDIAGAQSAIRAAGLPHALADRLEYGQ